MKNIQKLQDFQETKVRYISNKEITNEELFAIHKKEMQNKPSFNGNTVSCGLLDQESLKNKKPFWFVSHIGFEEYELKENRLILSLRKWSLEDPKTVTVYVKHPVRISTEIYYNYEKFVLLLDKIYNDNDVCNYNFKAYISSRCRDKKAELETRFPKFSFQIENSHLFVLNVELPCDRRILNKLKKYKFQTKNLNKVIRRELGWMYREVSVSSSMEHLFSGVEKLGNLYEKASDIVSSFYPSEKYDPIIASKRTKAFNQVRIFFREQNTMNLIENSPNSDIIAKRFPIVKQLILKDRKKFQELENVMNELSSLFFTLNQTAKYLDEKNCVRFNQDTNTYELVLNARNASNPFEKGTTEPNGLVILDNRLPYECWKSLSTCFLDIEKPMWKTEEERKLLDQISDLQVRLLDIDSKEDPSELKDKISELTKKLLFKSMKSGDIDLTQDRYKEQISRVMMHFSREDGSQAKFYLKLNNPLISNQQDKPKELNGFVVLYFDSEYELINAALNIIKLEQPYRIVGHVIPYDLSQIRDSARENKTAPFEIAVKNKEPRMWRRGFYQKISMAAQEIVDTYRLSAVMFPYLKLKVFDSSHKLADVSNFIYREKKRMGIPTVMPEEFQKLVTHDELKELEIKAINGDRNSEQILDQYSTHDIDPLREIFIFEPLLKTIYNAAAMVPHSTFTDVLFSPNSISEIFHIREWQERHSQLNYSYKEKMREDERQIFKKRLDTYMKRQLADEGIMQLPSKGEFRNVYITYIPLELLVSGTFYPNTPQWLNYFSNLDSDPIIKVAQLQYPKYFMRRHIHVDYYLYRREKDIIYEFIDQIGLKPVEMMELFHIYFDIISKYEKSNGTSAKFSYPFAGGKSLIGRYKRAYLRLKDKFRSFYTTLKVKDKTSSRKIKAFLRTEISRREDKQMLFSFVDLFSKENSDLLALNELPTDYIESLEDESKEKLEIFKKQFTKFKEIEKSILDIFSKEQNKKIIEKISYQNLMFGFNQFYLATRRKEIFNAVYHINPEGPSSFREFLNSAYYAIGDWIRKNNISVIGAKGDYLYVKENPDQPIDFSNAPVIPLRKFEKIDLSSDSKSEDTDDELFT